MNALLTVQDVHAGYLPGVDILRGLSLTRARTRSRWSSVRTAPANPRCCALSSLSFRRTRAPLRSTTNPPRGCARATCKTAGISYVTQDINSFPLLTVEENLRMGAWVFRRDGERLRRQIERVYETFPVLADKRRARAGELSGGQGRMLSVAREMMTEPRLLLVDEPTAGLAPNLVEQVYENSVDGEKRERGRNPARRAKRRAGAAARRPSVSSQPRSGEGRRPWPGIR